MEEREKLTMTNQIKSISTTKLAKKYNISTSDMFARLLQLDLIEKKQDVWHLTDLGIQKGGKFVNSEKYGKYITWPDDINLSFRSGDLVTATTIGKHFNISAQKVNYIMSELGWAEKAIKGWKITQHGEHAGGLQSENKKSGVPYIKWPETILNSKVLIRTIEDTLGVASSQNEEVTHSDTLDFREKFEAKHRTTDGHFVRSKAEMLIDNWLYMAEIVHAYERKLPIEEDVFSDFYIPTGKVYIEFWGYENNDKYIKRKRDKQEIYKKYGFNLIELTDEDVFNLDDVLPRLLLKHNVQSY